MAYYLRDTTTAACGDYDLSADQGTPATLPISVGAASYSEVASFEIVVGAAGPTGTFGVSVDINAVVNVAGVRWRLQRVNSICEIQESSGYSAEYTTAGIKTDDIAFSPTWASGDILRLSVEGKKGGASGTLTLNVQDADSRIDPPGGTDNLTASNLETTTPVLGSPTIGQAHALSASSLADTPALGTPTLGQTHVLAASALETVPALGAPTLAVIENLTSQDLAGGTPSLGTPALGQAHVLSADLLVGGTPTLGAPTLGQAHALSATSLETTPVLGTPTLSTEGEDNLDASDLTGGIPTLGAPTIGQEHVLSATGLLSTPALGTPTLGVVEHLAADPLTGGTPLLGTPTVGQGHALAANGLTTTPILGQPALGVIRNLVASGLETTPTLGQPTLGVIRNLAASNLTGGTPELGAPSIGQGHALSATGLVSTPVLGTPTLSTEGTDNLAADNLNGSAAVLGTPSIGQTHVLGSTALITTPVLGTPTLAVFGEDNLIAVNLDGGTPTLGQPTIGQTHALLPDGILVTVVLGTPTLSGYVALSASSLTGGAPVLGTPTLTSGELVIRMSDLHGITELIKFALRDLLTQKMITELPDWDAMKDCQVVIGKIQDDPLFVNVEIYEGFTPDPDSWPHRAKKLPGPRNLRNGQIIDPSEDSQRVRNAVGKLTMSGWSLNTRAFTVELEIAGNSALIDVDRDDVTQACGITEARVRRTLLDAQAKMGLDTPPADDFGERVLQGPFFGDHWMERVESESLRTKRYIQFWYETGYAGPNRA